MAAVTICSDFGAQENNACHCFHYFLIYLSWSDGTRCHDLIFECWVLSQLFHSPLSPSSRGSLVPLGFLPWGWCHLHTEVIDISPSNLVSSLCFIQPHILHDVVSYKLNKPGDNIQSWCTPFIIWNQSILPCPVLTVASWPAYRVFRRQVRWSGIPISLRISHSLLWSTQRL